MRAIALAGRGWILVTGSLRLVGEIRSIIRELGAEPRRFSFTEKGSNKDGPWRMMVLVSLSNRSDSFANGLVLGSFWIREL